MVGLFSFDGPIYKDRNGIYCDTYITNEILQRFFVVCDKLILLIRCFEIQETYSEKNLPKLETSPNNIELVEMPNINSPLNYITRHKYIKQIEDVVNRSDMVFLRIPSVLSDMVGDICIKRNKPYCIEVGGCSFDSYWNHDITGRCIAPFMFLHQRYTVGHASYASYVTEKWLQQRYPTKANMIISASNVYLTDFNEEKIKEKSKSWSTKKDVYTVGTIAGYEVRYKGQHKVIKALSILKKKGIIFKYELVGNGDPTWLKSVAAKYDVLDQVVFLGVKQKNEVKDWLYNDVNIYIQPSKQEGLPRSVIEAMNQGCVCLGSRKAGIPELLEEDEMFYPSDVIGMADKLEMVITDGKPANRVMRNYEKSKRYDLKYLTEKRTTLFMAYKNSLSGKS